MTRKEIEKRCREEMQQNIPDKDALWQKIESQLPEQKPIIQPQKPVIKMHTFYRVMAGVACFMFVLAGASLVRIGRNHSEMMTTPMADSSISADAEPAENNAEVAGDDAESRRRQMEEGSPQIIQVLHLLEIPPVLASLQAVQKPILLIPLMPNILRA